MPFPHSCLAAFFTARQIHPTSGQVVEPFPRVVVTVLPAKTRGRRLREQNVRIAERQATNEIRSDPTRPGSDRAPDDEEMLDAVGRLAFGC